MKGHYSVLEPDGSIRTVTYTADAKSGFNAVVKTVGASSHPVTESPHGTESKSDDTSQSKINHYSKDQEHIVLSSDIKPIKKPIEDLTHAHPKIPSLIEFKPHARIRQVPMELEPGMRERLKEAREEYYQKYAAIKQQKEEREHDDFQPSGSVYASYDNDDSEWKAVVKDNTEYSAHQNYDLSPGYYHQPADYALHQPQYYENKYHHKHHNQGNSHSGYGHSHSKLNTDFIASKPLNNHNNHRPSVTSSGSQPDPHINTIPFHSNKKTALPTTPGLKHYASLPNKYLNNKPRRDYAAYFQRSKSKKPRKYENKIKSSALALGDLEEIQSSASASMIQSMIKRDKKHLTPMYARNYGISSAERPSYRPFRRL